VTQRAVAALPRGALAGSAAGKAVEALTLAGLVAVVPRALGAADYGSFAVALAVATGTATATGIGGPALFARVLAPLGAGARRDVARALVRRVAAARAALLALLAAATAAVALLAPGSVSALQLALVGSAAALGAGATLVSQLALGLERTLAWSLRYPLENAVIAGGALVLYPLAGLDGALAAITLGAAAALALAAAATWPALRGARAGGTLPAGTLRFARLQAAGGALTQAVHRGAAPACALLGLTSAATGQAAIAAGAALAITYAVAQTTLVALPAATRAFPRDRAAAEAALLRVAVACGVVVLPACALLALVAEPLLAAVLGEEFRTAAAPLRIALGAAALAPLWAFATQLAALRDRPQASLAGAAGGAVAFAAIAVVAIPQAGASGAAAAMLAGVGATVAGTLAALRGRNAVLG
jgi:O-antigen/teichoic acid export membrane protein